MRQIFLSGGIAHTHTHTHTHPHIHTHTTHTPTHTHTHHTHTPRTHHTHHTHTHIHRCMYSNPGYTNVVKETEQIVSLQGSSLYPMYVVKVKVKYSKTKYRPVGLLLDVSAVIYCKCKLQLKFRNNKNYLP